MPISKRQAHALYNCENPDNKPDRSDVHKLSNWDLLKDASQGYSPEFFAAAVFLRPKMAMRYKLLPALAQQLAHARPVASKAFPVKTPEERLRRSLALIVELADENWSELPRTWGYLGSALETMALNGTWKAPKSSKNWGSALKTILDDETVTVSQQQHLVNTLKTIFMRATDQEENFTRPELMDVVFAVIDSILKESTVRNPMKFLKKFSDPPTDNTAWERFYWLSGAELEEFRNEREETLKCIDEEVSKNAESKN